MKHRIIHAKKMFCHLARVHAVLVAGIHSRNICRVPSRGRVLSALFLPSKSFREHVGFGKRDKIERKQTRWFQVASRVLSDRTQGAHLPTFGLERLDVTVTFK